MPLYMKVGTVVGVLRSLQGKIFDAGSYNFNDVLYASKIAMGFFRNLLSHLGTSDWYFGYVMNWRLVHMTSDVDITIEDRR